MTTEIIEMGSISTPAVFKYTGLCEIRNVTHDGACGYRCIAEFQRLRFEVVVERCYKLCNVPEFAPIKGLVNWCINLEEEFMIYSDPSVRKKYLTSKAYLNSDIMSLYAIKFDCLFVIVRQAPSERGKIEILQVLPGKKYESNHQMLVILNRGDKFDCIVPIRGKESEFDKQIRDAAEVIYFLACDFV
jgi:hypothetical protein